MWRETVSNVKLCSAFNVFAGWQFKKNIQKMFINSIIKSNPTQKID